MAFSVLNSTQEALQTLVTDPSLPIPPEVRALLSKTTFTNQSDPILPCPFRQLEAAAALKAVEAAVANAIGKVRFGLDQSVTIDLQHATLFLLMAYIATVDGLGKQDHAVKVKLKDTDLLAAQSNPYRRMSANMYRTKEGKYYHIHGSLEATTTLNMIGLPGHQPDLTNYQQIIKVIGSAVQNFTVPELERLNAKNRQAGVEVLKHEDFLSTPQGAETLRAPLWSLEPLEQSSPPVPFSTTALKPPQILNGIKVLELCRIIAGPTGTRILAEYGAEVLKVTSPNLSDVLFFQVDGNVGKRTTDLDLKNNEDRATFEKLLEEADVVVDGYRPDAISRLGYGPQQLSALATKRGKGFVYVNENCFGYRGSWASRPGWQQIADCVSGIAWAQGLAMGLDEPLVPPFPMSDYGTGVMCAIAALTGIYKRGTVGGSWWGGSSLVAYDMFLFRLGMYPAAIWEQIREQHDADFFKLRYYDSVDRISAVALKSMKRVRPELFADHKYMERHHSVGFHGEVELLSPVVRMSVTRNGFNGATRPNGFDAPIWLGLGSWDQGPTVAFRSTENDKPAELNGNEENVGNGYEMNGE